MPVYEYVCSKCEKTTEAIRRMSDADEAINCEHCGSSKTKRAHSVFATGGSQPDFSPPPGCGRCGDPNGACGL